MSPYEGHKEFCVTLRVIKETHATFDAVVTAIDMANAQLEAERLVALLNGLVAIDSIKERKSRKDC